MRAADPIVVRAATRETLTTSVLETIPRFADEKREFHRKSTVVEHESN
jgi:hypothetical protein